MEKIGLFIGTRRGYQVLRELINNKIVVTNVLVLIQEKHEYENFSDKIILLCQKHGIGFQISTEVKSENYQEYLLSIQIDILFVVSWRSLIRSACFNIPRLGIYILHDSLLPQYAGFAPTNWVIINGEKETGLSLIKISSVVDAGDIVDQITIPISDGETAQTLNDKFCDFYPQIVLKNLKGLFKQEIVLTKQDLSQVTYSCKRIPEDGRINFTKTTKEIVNLIGGLTYPYPGAFCYYNKNKIIIWKAENLISASDYVGRIPGKIVRINDGSVDVLTGDGVLRIFEVGINENLFCDPSMIMKSIYYSLSSE